VWKSYHVRHFHRKKKQWAHPSDWPGLCYLRNESVCYFAEHEDMPSLPLFREMVYINY
jgi:hypothetical protein